AALPIGILNRQYSEKGQLTQVASASKRRFASTGLSSDPITMKKVFGHLLSLSLLLAGSAVNFAQQPKPPQKPGQPGTIDQGQDKPEVINVRRVRLPIT